MGYITAGPTAHVRMSAGQREGRQEKEEGHPIRLYRSLQILQWLPKIIHSHELEGSDTVTEDDQKLWVRGTPMFEPQKIGPNLQKSFNALQFSG